MHLTDEVLAPIRARYGEPALLEWKGEISEHEYGIATYDPVRTHDVTLFILNGRPARPDPEASVPARRLASARRRGQGGRGLRAGRAPRSAGGDGSAGRADRYLVETRARFVHDGRVLDWRTHVFSATTGDEAIAPLDTVEIAEARWGTLEELEGPLRERLLATGRAFWRYRVALHDAAAAELVRAFSLGTVPGGDCPAETAASSAFGVRP